MADIAYSSGSGGRTVADVDDQHVSSARASDTAPEPMDDAQFAITVKQALDDAVDYIDGYVARQRANATSYYRGDLFGNEEPGRSQIVMTEVRDTVLAMLPSLLRIFTTSEQAVTFEPRTKEKIEQAEQATDLRQLHPLQRQRRLFDPLQRHEGRPGAQVGRAQVALGRRRRDRRVRIREPDRWSAPAGHHDRRRRGAGAKVETGSQRGATIDVGGPPCTSPVARPAAGPRWASPGPTWCASSSRHSDASWHDASRACGVGYAATHGGSGTRWARWPTAWHDDATTGTTTTAAHAARHPGAAALQERARHRRVRADRGTAGQSRRTRPRSLPAGRPSQPQDLQRPGEDGLHRRPARQHVGPG